MFFGGTPQRRGLGGNLNLTFVSKSMKLAGTLNVVKTKVLVICKNSAATLFSYTPSMTNMAMVHTTEVVPAYLKVAAICTRRNYEDKCNSKLSCV